MARPSIVRFRRRNFFALALHQIIFRIGWIFKTESIIMPAVLDSLGGSAWLRGILPTLNRLGQSIPPILFANRLRASSQKRWAFGFYVGAMGVCFLVLSVFWQSSWVTTRHSVPIFLTIYGIFFVCKGLSDLALSTLQGKLIPVRLRGRLLVASNTTGALISILFAWQLLTRWIQDDRHAFHLVFGFTGICFILSAFTVFGLSEENDVNDHDMITTNPFVDSVKILANDSLFRRLATIGFLFGVSMSLFPHYQALGRDRLGISFGSLASWVIVQNLGTAIFSLVIGPLADWKGNRLVLRGTMFGITIMPLLALWLSRSPFGAAYYGAVFVLFGLTPVTIRILNNFALELAPQEQHPRYLSTLSTCIAIPLYAAPLFGLAIDVFDFDVPLMLVSIAVGCGWLLTLSIPEPRMLAVPEVQELP